MSPNVCWRNEHCIGGAVSPEGAGRVGGRLGPDHSGQGVERLVPARSAAAALVRQELEAGDLEGSIEYRANRSA